jgi:arginase family enzyme
MSYPAPGGASLEQLTKTFRHLAGTGKVSGASLSSWNPKLAGSALSARVCMQLLQTLLGE